MSPRKARYVSLCQQVLTLLAVGAVGVTAANVVALDVVHGPEVPAASTAAAVPGVPAPAAAGVDAATSDDQAPVATGPVESTVEEVALTDGAGAADAATTETEVPQAPAPEASPEVSTETSPEAVERTEATEAPEAPATPSAEPTEPTEPTEVAGASTELLSDPQPVTGFGAVGVTWSPDTPVYGDDISLTVRTRDDGGEWTAWETIPYEDAYDSSDDVPAGDTESEGTRPGTELVWVGEVDEAQVRAVAPGGLPADLKVAVIDPGSTQTVEEAPEYAGGSVAAGEDTETTLSTDQGDVALQAASTGAAQPAIYSRSQWGADESMRDGNPRYATVRGAVIHHTVNANNYTEAQVPGIIRGIYAYHVRSQGWSDVGYNFLVDKFGRLWEGRAGGITRAVRGAHIAAHNDWAFGISAIGNYETAQPTAAMQEAIAKLIAWKLSIHGISATSTQTWGSVRMPAIIGHRDGGSTACPGRYLYAKLGAIRTRAQQLQSQGATNPTPAPPQVSASAPNITDSSLVGSDYPDVAYRHSDGTVYITPTQGGTWFSGKHAFAKGYTKASGVVVSPDLTGDGRPDIVHVDPQGTAWLKRGEGGTRFVHDFTPISRSIFTNTTNLTAIGDVDGDGNNDLIARNTSNNLLTLYLGDGKGGFRWMTLGRQWHTVKLITTMGDVTGDGVPDLIVKDRDDKLWIYPITSSRRGHAALGQRIPIPGSFPQVAAIAGVGDATGDGRPDLALRLTSGSVYLMSYLRPGVVRGMRGPVNWPGQLTNLSGGIDLTGDGEPDLVGRVGNDLFVVAHSGRKDVAPTITTNIKIPTAVALWNVGDWDRDGHGDLMSQERDGTLTLWRGNSTGRFWAFDLGRSLAGISNLRYVGDVTGDGFGDLMGLAKDKKTWQVHPGWGRKGFVAGRSVNPALVRWFDHSGVDLQGADLVSVSASLSGGRGMDLVVRHRASKQLRVIQRDTNGRVTRHTGFVDISDNLNLLG
ncbi:FG-GAP-like repeat-containing protein [Nocardioides zeae]|uniref:FG-GAP-like repeat-containing protein n=1 Tax=Nocardioides imazamoxiresistens TaxID=3231893 RepID=A0ABU3PTZ4_9ACTN|nr:FG-GAP-like repeat-containing protein [Nocardioides zeae]MDT9592690.1 FG-GAP-like repeat-containing protein [Nocardioides zeae]